MADGQSEWAWYLAALRGVFGPVQESAPQTGYYRHFTGSPVAIWRDDSGHRVMLLGEDEIDDPVEQGRIWLSCAKRPVEHKHYVLRTTTGMWPGLPDKLAAGDKGEAAAPPAVVAVGNGDAATTAERGAPDALGSVPGDNSRDLDAFRRMRAEILNDIGEAKALAARKITRKDEADRLHDWGGRLAAAASAADEARLAETKPLRDQVDEINARWNAIIKPARQESVDLRDLAQQWGRAETERLRKIAEVEAAAERERQRLAREADAASAAIVAAPEPLSPSPIVAEPKLMIGTVARRSVRTKEPDTATIVDLGAAAAHFAAQAHPELVALIQKLADRAIKARAEMPGIRFSWQSAKENA